MSSDTVANLDLNDAIGPAAAQPAQTRSAEAPAPPGLHRIVIKPRRGWQSLELPELYRYRHLLLAFLWRDVKASQKQTALGILWLFIAPLFSVAVFTLVFGRLAKIPSDGIPYPLFVFAGYLLWNAFGPAIQASTHSVVSNAHFIQKVYFPRLLIPASAALSGIVNLAIVFLCLLGLMLFFGRFPPWTALLGLPIAVCVLATGLGLGMWLAPLHVRFRDVGYLTNYAIQIGFYLTPVVYPVSLVPARFRPWLILNPMAGYIDAFRCCLFGGDWNPTLLAGSLLATVTLLLSGAFLFARQQARFADII